MALIASKVTNDPITAAWANQIRDQTLQVTLSSARPSSPTEGMAIYETDTDKVMIYDGAGWVCAAHLGAWTSFTAQFDRSANPSFPLAGTTNYARYTKLGRRLSGQVHWTSTTTLATPGTWSFQLPSSLVAVSSAVLMVGTGYLFTGGVTKRAVVQLANTTHVSFTCDDVSAVAYAGNMASGDSISYVFEVETTT